MKKSKLLMIPAVTLSAFMGVMLSNANNVEAANNECSTGYTKTKYMDKISYNVSGNVVSYTGASGLLYSTSFDGTQHQVDSSGSFSFTIPDDQIDSRITVYFYLPESDGVCEAGKEIGNNTLYANTSGRNQLYDNALCVNYRNKWSNNKTMREAVPYCFSEEVSVQYSYDEVSSWINDAESLYDIQQNGSSSIVQDPSYTNVKDVTKTDKLVCDAFSTDNYETMHKYSHKESETVDNCTTTCKEEIEVNFSDPVATQAGMCFQYLIEIKSKVTCDSYYTAPRPSKPAVCVPTAYCVASNGYESEKGGPTEDFDACVNECDGGEYTQSCIDKCYTKVYATDNKSTIRQTAFESIPSMFTTDYSINSTSQATKLANGCLTPSNTDDARALYEQHQRDPGGKYVGNKWIPSESGCSSNLGQFYFRSEASTRQTINEVQGNYSDSHGKKQYSAGSNGFLIRTKINGYSNVCDDTCKWVNKCGSNTVLTQYLADQQYQKELEEWQNKKTACEQKAATCTNETTDYEIVVDNVDTDSDKNDDEETFSSSQKLNGTTVSGEFPDMVILTDGSCEDGKDDPWNYHNIITFPGTWVNNKTGQTVHSMEPGHEDFYTYVGNSYCTKLNSVPINTAWYDWKVNQNGDESALTDSEKKEIEDNIEMNINGHIDNYGYFGWDFDISCFYAVGEPDSECTPSDPNFPNCDDGGKGNGNGNTDGGNSASSTAPVDDYNFRSISLDNLFPNSVTPTSGSLKDTQAALLINEVESLRGNNATQVADDDMREIGFNWTCAATNLENPDYIVQPVSLINEIQTLGDSIYEGDDYLDYHIRLTPETMKKVRAYNNKYHSYTEPSGQDAEEKGLILKADDTNKTAGITVYRSYLLHEVLNSNELLKSGLIGCNNEGKGENVCNNTIDTSTACYNEYMAQSSVLKGAK